MIMVTLKNFEGYYIVFILFFFQLQNITYTHTVMYPTQQCIRVEFVKDIDSFQYLWVDMCDIRLTCPSPVTLTNRSGNVFYIPVSSTKLFVSETYLILCCTQNREDAYALLTRKEFSNTFTDHRGHKLKVIGSLAQPPLAWVKVLNPAAYVHDTTCAHEQETAVSALCHTLYYNIYTLLSDHNQTWPGVQSVLSRIAAPLAYKALYEQARFTVRSKNSAACNDGVAYELGKKQWGASVMCIVDSQGAVSYTPFDQETDCPDMVRVQDSDLWLRITVTYTGLEITVHNRSLLSTAAVKTSYDTIVLAALCRGAYNVWNNRIGELSSAISVTLRSRQGVCQRCGYSFSVPPQVCDPVAKRVPAVVQLDRILLGELCTTLCSTVCWSNGFPRSQSSRYCLNHKRLYAESQEECLEKSGVEETNVSSAECRGASRGHISRRKEDYDHDWWLWQKTERGNTVNDRVFRKQRLSFLERSGREPSITDSSRESRSSRYWMGFTCQALGSHSEIVPLSG